MANKKERKRSKKANMRRNKRKESEDLIIKLNARKTRTGFSVTSDDSKAIIKYIEQASNVNEGQAECLIGATG